jgi:hypothetical protein
MRRRVRFHEKLRAGEFIDEFVSGGPKNYAYRVNRTDTSS